MILSKKDTVEFLHNTSRHPKKGNMKTVLDMVRVGKDVGYQISKVGIDQYKIIPNYFIRNISKPVIVDRTLPTGIDGVMDGKPWGKIVRDIIEYCGVPYIEDLIYLFGLKDGDTIDLGKITSYGLAIAQFAGYVYEGEEYIYIYYYPKMIDQGQFDWEGNLYDWK